MKKFLFILCLSLVFFGTVHVASATYGACSSHGGVNCAVGSDFDGSVICNDGWSGSTVNFSDAGECKISSCTPPIANGCQTENDYGALNVRLNAQGGYLGASASQQGALAQCRQQINNYQTQYQTYQQCLSSSVSSSNNNLYNYSPKVSSTELYKIAGDTVCRSTYGNFSVYSADIKDCACASGYRWSNNNQCVPVTQSCTVDYGPTAWYNADKNNCSWCLNGATRSGNTCIPPVATTTTQQVKVASQTILSTSTPVFVFNQNLSLGMRGNDVVQLQLLLQKSGYLSTDTTATGYFGMLTKNAVIAFQQANNISPAQGFVGLITRTKINQK